MLSNFYTKQDSIIKKTVASLTERKIGNESEMGRFSVSICIVDNESKRRPSVQFTCLSVFYSLY